MDLDFSFNLPVQENAEDQVTLSPEETTFLEETALLLGLEAEDAGEIELALTEAAMPARTIIRLSKQDKLKGLTMTSALTIAQQKKDPLYVKFAKFSKLRWNLKQQILKKYRGAATVTAREILRNVGKRGASPADMGQPAKNTV